MQTNERTIREIIIQQNVYQAEMAIVPVTGTTKEDKNEVETILSRSLYIIGIEATKNPKKMEDIYSLQQMRIKLMLNMK